MTVEYCSTHTGHSVDLAHLPISSEVRHSIASKLYGGVSVDTILENVRDSMPYGKISRKQLLSCQDVLNIKMQLNIDSIMKHSNECAMIMSVSVHGSKNYEIIHPIQFYYLKHKVHVVRQPWTI